MKTTQIGISIESVNYETVICAMLDTFCIYFDFLQLHIIDIHGDWNSKTSEAQDLGNIGRSSVATHDLVIRELDGFVTDLWREDLTNDSRNWDRLVAKVGQQVIRQLVADKNKAILDKINFVI